MKHCLILFLLIITNVTFAQNKKIDSLKSLLNDVKDIEKKSSLELSLAVEFIKIRDLEKASKISNKVLIGAIEINNPSIIADAYLNLGNIHYINWEGPEAINYYQKVDSILSENNIVNKTLYKSKSNIGNLMYRTAQDSLDYIKIKDYFNESLEIARVLKDSTQQAYMLIKLGDIDQSNLKYDSALAMYKKAEKLINKNNSRLTDLYWALAEVYFNKNDILNGKKYTYKRYELVKNATNISDKAYANWVHGNLLFMAKDYESTIKYHKLSISLYDSLKFRDYGRLSGASDRIYKSYQKLGDYKQAFNYLEKAMIYNDSGLAKTRNNKVEELETKYQTEKKEQEIALLEFENKLINQKQKSQRNLFIGGLAITSIAGLFLFILFRNRKKTNTKLKELDAIKSNFFANISHEFRTPLTLIANPIETTLNDDTISEVKREQFITAKRNSDRLLALVNQILDLSKIDADQLKLHIQKANAITHVAALTESFDHAAKQKQIKYHLHINPHTENVYFDRDALEKIIVNLISNAIKYTPGNGSVHCDAFIKNNKLYFIVKNSGVGLTADEIKHIFQRFYQTKDQNQGTGIGLALVKELVDLHKGSIDVESTPNQWTTFTVLLPVDKQSYKNETFVTNNEDITINTQPLLEEKTEVTTEEEFNDTDEPILLLVEDNDDVRLLLKRTFEANYNIITAPNGEKGIELALEHIPDLIISDIMMPVKDGIALTEHLKNDERTSHIPIILLTAKAGDDNKLTGLEIGADDYITKPFNSKLLTTKVEKLIENRRLLQQRYSQELVLLPKDISITNLDEQFLEKVQTTLDKNLIEPSFNVTEFSEAVGMSRMQLHRKLKALTGLTASEFIRSQRLKLAAQFLKTSDINISQVGYSVGFNDHSYFTKCFKEFYKCTPTEYAKRK